METETKQLFHGFDLSEFEDEEKAQALIQHLKLDAVEYNDTLEQNGLYFMVNDPPKDDTRRKEAQEYKVLTDKEADDAVDDYLDRNIWVEAVKANNTDEGLDDWKETVKRSDGRGMLASYDGSEEDEDVNGTTYYIYRTN